MINLLLLGSLVIIACILCNRLTNRFGIPMLLAFILLGMVFGSEGIFRIPFDDFSFAEDVCTVALIFIMFYVLLSISFQGTLLPSFARRTRMLDESGDILTTFSDYTDETDIRFIDIPIRPGHPWTGKQIRDLNLPPETLLVFLRRVGECLVPNGNTIIQEQDVLVLGASAYTGDDDIHLTEISVDSAHPWCGKTLRQLNLPKNSLIILIRRGGETLIPNGQTQILSGDVMVMNTVH